MRKLRFEVLRSTTQGSELRFFGSDGKALGQRILDPAEIEILLQAVDESYAVGPASLDKLGQQLYDWLDGPERWMRRACEGALGLAIDIVVDGRLRHLPWELLAESGRFLCIDSLFTPVRRVSRFGAEPEVQNRPLRVLFMACSAEDTHPVLDFDSEESLVLKATDRQPIELKVEESGSVAGLAQEIVSFAGRHFDVCHLSGHAGVVKGKPRFLMEDEFGRRKDAEAEDLAGAFDGRWPRLLFLSGCRTGQAVDHGVLPSLCEALVLAGAPAVLGWALPVGDKAASIASAELYRQLAIGQGVDEAVSRTRQALYKKGLPDWHLLRLYADRTPLSALVTPLKTPGREALRVRRAEKVFIDERAENEVCPREYFVGRRRLLQRSLAVLTSNQESPLYADGLLLCGLGGLGKSSVAVRLCERLPGLSRWVWVGRIDEERFLGKFRKRIKDASELEHLDDRLPLKTRLCRLLEGSFAAAPAIFVFDDFEHNLEVRADGSFVVELAALDVLTSVLEAIHETASESRALITCRYGFEIPRPARLHCEALESMRGADLKNMLNRLAERQEGATVQWSCGTFALAAGNPLLLERMWTTVTAAHAGGGAAPSLALLVEDFRQEMRLSEWVARQGSEGRRVLALLSAFAWPVERTTLESVAASLPLDPHLDRAGAAGLVEIVRDSRRKTLRYYLSPLLRPLLASELMDTRRTEDWRSAAQQAVAYFQTHHRSDVAETRDVDLLVAACNLLIATHSHEAVARLLIEQLDPYLMGLGAYDQLIELHTEVSKVLATPQLRTLSAIEVANAQLARGEAELAAEILRSVTAASEIRDPQHEAIVLNNLGSCYLQLCDFDRAVAPLEEAAALSRREGWHSIEVLATANRAWCYEVMGDCARALRIFEAMRRWARERRMEAEEISCLLSVGNCRAALGAAEEAVSLFEEVLARLDGREALTWGTTLHSLAESLIDLGRLGAAIEAAETGREIGTRIASPKLQIECYSALARAFLLAGQARPAIDAARSAAQLGVPFYRPYADFLLGLAQLAEGESSPATRSWAVALAGADALLVKCKQNLMALETRALALAGMARNKGGPATGGDEEALRVIRELHSGYDLAGRAKRFDGLVGLLHQTR
jgi:tetratricopeptide (TPR) repeat protein/CHAT domain-containing protein